MADGNLVIVQLLHCPRQKNACITFLCIFYDGHMSMQKPNTQGSEQMTLLMAESRIGDVIMAMAQFTMGHNITFEVPHIRHIRDSSLVRRSFAASVAPGSCPDATFTVSNRPLVIGQEKVLASLKLCMCVVDSSAETPAVLLFEWPVGHNMAAKQSGACKLPKQLTSIHTKPSVQSFKRGCVMLHCMCQRASALLVCPAFI